MIEGGFTSAGRGGVGEFIDGEPGLEASAETMLGGFEPAGGELVVGAATEVMGGACAAGITTGDGDAGFGCVDVGRDGVGSVMGVDGGDCGAGAADGVEAIGAAPPWFSKISCRFPPMERLMACSSKLARLCTMPIQLPATCTTARWGSSRTSCACCDSSIRVEGSSRLARICCHSSGRLLLSGAGSCAAGGVCAGSELTTGCGLVLGRLTGGGAGVSAIGAVLVTAAVLMAGVLTSGGLMGGLLTGAAELGFATGRSPSARRPSSNTSSHNLGCTL